MRNRIISGLGLGTVVIEADDRSGALITAKEAIVQGRNVFAIPGNVDEKNAIGTNALIKDGATAVTCAADILETYRYLYRGMIDVTELKRASMRSELVPGALAKHGVDEGEPSVEPKKKEEAPLSHLLHTRKKIDGETVKTVSGERDYPVNEPSVLPVESAPRAEADASVDALAQLDEMTRSIFEQMPVGKPVSVDYLCSLGFDVSHVMIAFTMLEFHGLADSYPGGLYARK